MKFAIITAWILVLLVISIALIPHSFVNAKSKDSKARRDIDKSIGRAVEGTFSSVKTVNISTYAAPNVSLTVYNKSSSGSLPPIITPPEPQPTPPPVVTPAEGYKVCMVGDFKDAKVFDAMKTNGGCDYRVALGDNGYGSSLDLLKKIAPDRCQIGNHDSPENGNDKIYQEALAYCGNSWWVKFGSGTLMLGFNTNGDTAKQLTAVQNLFNNSQFMSGVKNVMTVSHKNGHVPPNAHHPAEAKDFFASLEKSIPAGLNLFEVSSHNHQSSANAASGWYLAGAGGRSFYQCGVGNGWTFCNNKAVAYLEATIPNDGEIAFHFVDTSGKTIY